MTSLKIFVNGKDRHISDLPTALLENLIRTYKATPKLLTAMILERDARKYRIEREASALHQERRQSEKTKDRSKSKPQLKPKSHKKHGKRKSRATEPKRLGQFSRSTVSQSYLRAVRASANNSSGVTVASGSGTGAARFGMSVNDAKKKRQARGYSKKRYLSSEDQKSREDWWYEKNSKYEK